MENFFPHSGLWPGRLKPEVWVSMDAEWQEGGSGSSKGLFRVPAGSQLVGADTDRVESESIQRRFRYGRSEKTYWKLH